MNNKMIGFREFLPKTYTHLAIYDMHKKTKVKVNVGLIVKFFSIDEAKTAVVYYEGDKIRYITTPYSFQQIAGIFTEDELS